jgi:hypothetical protein
MGRPGDDLTWFEFEPDDKINVGGALEKGSDQYTNLNPVNPNSDGATKGIPNHVQASFEEIGEIFQPGTVKEIISNRLRYVDVKDWKTAARGAFKVLAPGGRLGSGHPASGMNVWADEQQVDRHLQTQVDTIVRINQRTASVASGNDSNWRLPFALLRHVVNLWPNRRRPPSLTRVLR